MSETLFAVQDAVYDTLMASATIQAVIGNPARLYDHVIPGVLFPFVAFGDMQAEPFDTKDRTGMEQILSLHIWSRYRGRKEIKDISKAIYNVLHNASLTVTGHEFVSCQFAGAEMRFEDDGLSYHGILRYRVVTQVIVP
jgi:hypothetical protein